MKSLLASTALLLGGAGVAFADVNAATPLDETANEAAAETVPMTAAELQGAVVYRTDGALDLDGDLQEVGEVAEVMIGDDGSLQTIAATVGGFLGLGERTVALDLSEARLLMGRDGAPVVIVSTPAETLESAEEFDLASADLAAPEDAVDQDGLEASPGPETTPIADGDAEDARTAGTIAVDNEGAGLTTQSSVNLQENRSGAPTTPMNDQQSAASTTNVPDLDGGTVVDNPQTPATSEIEGDRVDTDTDVADDGTGTDEMQEGDATVDLDMAEADADVAIENPSEGMETDAGFRDPPVVERAGYTPVMADLVALPQLEGVEVYGAEDDLIGEIGYTVNAAASGTGHPMAILDIGGFLGLGEHEVAVPVQSIQFLDGEDGMIGYVSADKATLQQLPEYEG